MIDLTSEDLYIKKKRDMEKFLHNALKTEKQALEDDELDSEFDGLDGLDDFDMDGFGDNNVDFDDFFSGGSSFNDPFNVNDDIFNKAEPEERKPYDTENIALNLLISPYYLFYYMVKSIIDNQRLRNVADIKKFLMNQIKVSSVVLILTLFLLIFTDATFIFSLTIQSVLSVVLVGLSVLGYKLMDNPTTLKFFDGNGDGVLFTGNGDEDTHNDFDEDLDFDKKYNKNTKDDFGDFESDFGDFESDFGDFDTDNDFGDIDIDDFDDDFESDFGDINIDDFDKDFEFDDDELFNLPKEEVVHEEKTSVQHETLLPHSPIDVKSDESQFLNVLETIYDANEIYRGVEIKDRVELVKSLSGYLVANDKRFGVWDTVEENSTTYNNIMYTLYLGLTEIAPSFKDLTVKENRMVVFSCLENPLMYRVEVEVPNDTFKSLLYKKETFEKLLKVSDEDKEVQVMISAYQNGYVFKIVKPIRSFVSLGDILRFHNDQIIGDQIYDKYLNEKHALPVVLGLRDAEYPVMVDLAENTSVVIAGESGSGKSWGTFLVMMNLIFCNDYNDLNIVIMDKKKAMFWKQFANMPHVIGYHTDVEQYFDLLTELEEEMERRKALLEVVGGESWKGVRKSFLKKGEHERLKLFPWLLIIIDEVSNTQNQIMNMEDGKDKLKLFDSKLKMIAQEGRSLGMKLVLIGQRTIAEAMPKNAMLNSSMKFLFKLSPDDIDRTGLKVPKGLQTPQLTGQALIQDATIQTPQLLRTLTVGGIEDDQITNIIRLLALEWTRRSEGHNLTKPGNMSKVYNRPVIREQVFKDIENRKLFVEVGGGDSIESLDAIAEGKDVYEVKREMEVKKRKQEEEMRKLKEEEEKNPELKKQREEREREERLKKEKEEELKLKSISDEEGSFDFGEDLDFESDLFDDDELVFEDDEEFELDFDDSMFEDLEFDFDEFEKDEGDTSFDDFDFDENEDTSIFDDIDFDDFDEFEDDNSKLPENVDDYIRQFGESETGGVYRVSKSELENLYELKDIKKAVLRNKITVKGNYYIA